MIIQYERALSHSSGILIIIYPPPSRLYGPRSALTHSIARERGEGGGAGGGGGGGGGVGRVNIDELARPIHPCGNSNRTSSIRIYFNLKCFLVGWLFVWFCIDWCVFKRLHVGRSRLWRVDGKCPRQHIFASACQHFYSRWPILEFHVLARSLVTIILIIIFTNFDCQLWALFVFTCQCLAPSSGGEMGINLETLQVASNFSVW